MSNPEVTVEKGYGCAWEQIAGCSEMVSLDLKTLGKFSEYHTPFLEGCRNYAEKLLTINMDLQVYTACQYQYSTSL